MLAAWSLRVFIVTAGAWLILGTVYFARPSDPLLPAPLNVLLFVTLASLTTGALAAWFAARILGHLAHQSAKLEAVADSLEARDGRLYFELARVRGEVSQLRDLIEQTTDLTRPLALAGADYDNGFADGLARSPMKEAKILPMAPRDSGS